ncbi:MAG: hypothetical protein AB7F22_28870, partial [Reyranella sp.]|uniref:hypothetical protein n=1 Tax=Reyranella sp. TaxID=1929291 RepID=UPI003D0DB5A7
MPHFLLMTHPMSATGVARSLALTLPKERVMRWERATPKARIIVTTQPKNPKPLAPTHPKN